MALSVKKGTFTLLSTDSGTKQVRGVGFQPKTVLLFAGRAAADATWSAHAAWSLGALTEDAQGCAQMLDTDGIGTSNTGGNHRDDSALRGYSDGTPTTDWSLTAPATAMVSDGFDLTVADAPSQTIIIHYVAIGGTDVTDVMKGYTEVDGGFGVGTSVDITAPGFQPDLVIFFGYKAGQPVNGTDSVHAATSVGFARSDTQRACQSFVSFDAAGTMATASFHAARAFSLFRSTTSPNLEIGMDLAAKASWPANGFRITNQEGTGTQGDVGIHWVALKGAFQSSIGLANSPASAGNQDFDAGFPPGAAFFFSDDLPAHAAFDATHADGHGFSFGAYDGTDQGLIDFQQDDGNTNSVAKNISDVSRVLRLTGPGATPADRGMAVASFPAGNTVRLAWTNPSATVRQFAWVALGAGAADETPVAASESFTFAEEAALVAISATRSDSAITTDDAGTIAATLGSPDTFTLAVELAALTQERIASDAATLTEGAPSISEVLAVAASDSLALAEAALLAVAVARADSGDLTEGASTVATSLAGSDVLTLIEALTLAVATSAADNLVLNEAAADMGILETLNASDVLTLASEAAFLALDITRLDAATLAEGIVNVQLGASESHTLAEVAAVSAALVAADALALSESATGGEFREISASDPAALTEAALLETLVLKAASDALAHAESLGLAAALDRADMSAVTETLEIAAALLAEDHADAAEVALVAAALASTDAFTLADTASLNTAAFVRVLSALASAAARIGAMSSARTTSTATGRATATAAGDAEGGL